MIQVKEGLQTNQTMKNSKVTNAMYLTQGNSGHKLGEDFNLTYILQKEYDKSCTHHISQHES